MTALNAWTTDLVIDLFRALLKAQGNILAIGGGASTFVDALEMLGADALFTSFDLTDDAAVIAWLDVLPDPTQAIVAWADDDDLMRFVARVVTLSGAPEDAVSQLWHEHLHMVVMISEDASKDHPIILQIDEFEQTDEALFAGRDLFYYEPDKDQFLPTGLRPRFLDTLGVQLTIEPRVPTIGKVRDEDE